MRHHVAEDHAECLEAEDVVVGDDALVEQSLEDVEVPDAVAADRSSEMPPGEGGDLLALALALDPVGGAEVVDHRRQLGERGRAEGEACGERRERPPQAPGPDARPRAQRRAACRLPCPRLPTPPHGAAG